MKQKWSRQKCSHTDMFAEELPTRMPTYVPTRLDLPPAIVPPIIFNRDVDTLMIDSRLLHIRTILLYSFSKEITCCTTKKVQIAKTRISFQLEQITHRNDRLSDTQHHQLTETNRWYHKTQSAGRGCHSECPAHGHSACVICSVGLRTYTVEISFICHCFWFLVSFQSGVAILHQWY